MPEPQAAARRLQGPAPACRRDEAGEGEAGLRLWQLPAGLLMVEAPMLDGGPMRPPHCTIMPGAGPALRRITVLRMGAC